MFARVYWNQPVCPFVCVSVHVSVFVQNTSFCQRAGGGIKSHLVTALVSSTSAYLLEHLPAQYVQKVTTALKIPQITQPMFVQVAIIVQTVPIITTSILVARVTTTPTLGEPALTTVFHVHQENIVVQLVYRQCQGTVLADGTVSRGHGLTSQWTSGIIQILTAIALTTRQVENVKWAFSVQQDQGAQLHAQEVSIIIKFY